MKFLKYLLSLCLLAALAAGLFFFYNNSKKSALTKQRIFPQANLVICVLDAARADHFGAYGYARQTTPNFDRLAAESFLFEQHFTQASTSKPSTASLFTSQYPDTHLILKNKGSIGLNDSAFLISTALADSGLRTAFFSSNPWVSVDAGMAVGFDQAFGLEETAAVRQSGEHVWSPAPLMRLFDNWLKENPDSPFFAYLHFMPPHNPYEQPAAMTALFADQTPPGYQEDNYRPGRYDFPIGDDVQPHPPLPKWINLYDSNLRYGDFIVGQVEQALRESGVFDNTILIITSDHGESFGEHGYVYHAGAINREVTHIPLLIRPPGGTAPQRFSAFTQTIDLMPTLLEMLEVPYAQDELQGDSLLPLIRGETAGLHYYVFSRGESEDNQRVEVQDFDKYMIRRQEYALILYNNGTWRALYDLQTDPRETTNILQEQPEIAEELLSAFRQFAQTQTRPPLDFLDPDAAVAPAPQAPESNLTPKQRKALQSLGYLK